MREAQNNTSNCRKSQSTEYEVNYINGQINYQKRDECISAGTTSTSQFVRQPCELPTKDYEEHMTAECESEILS